MVGSKTAQLLGQRQGRVRVLVRDPEESTVPAHARAEVAAGGLKVPATTDTAMPGVSAVVLVSPAALGPELTAIGSAIRASAECIVKITSQAPADSPIARRRGQAQIEKGLTASPIGCMPLRNNAAGASPADLIAAHGSCQHSPAVPASRPSGRRQTHHRPETEPSCLLRPITRGGPLTCSRA
jgi:uncharacterized protein YbjT (DUF2867 family)